MSVTAHSRVSPGHTNAPPAHLGHLDSLRALAALLVVVGHAWLQFWPTDYHKSPPGWLLPWYGASLFLGRVSVDTFIVLSGFCLMLPIVRGDGTLRGGALQFFRKRARRILPPFYITTLLSLALIWLLIGHKTGTHWDVSIPVSPRGLLANLLMLQDVYGRGQINHVFWSIAVEWKIYFLFPLLLVGWRRWGALWTTAAAVVVSYALFAALHNTRFIGLTPQYLALFTLGMLGATLTFARSDSWLRVRQQAPWAGLSAGMAGVVAWGYGQGWLLVANRFGLMDLLIGLTVLPLLVATSRPGPSRIRHCLDWRPLVFVGTFAYSLYLVHAPLLQVLWQYGLRPLHLGPVPGFFVLVGAGVPLIVAAAYLLFLVAERPFLNSRPKESLAETARDAALAPAP